MTKITSLSLIDLAEQYGITLVQVGKLYQGSCPFHDDSTPSFTVYPDTNTFYCFGCKMYGDAITFLKKMDPELCKKINIRLLSMQTVLQKSDLEKRNMRYSLDLVASHLFFTAISKYGLAKVLPVMKNFDAYIGDKTYISVEEYSIIVKQLKTFLEIS